MKIMAKLKDTSEKRGDIESERGMGIEHF